MYESPIMTTSSAAICPFVQGAAASGPELEPLPDELAPEPLLERSISRQSSTKLLARVSADS